MKEMWLYGETRKIHRKEKKLIRFMNAFKYLQVGMAIKKISRNVTKGLLW